MKMKRFYAFALLFFVCGACEKKAESLDDFGTVRTIALCDSVFTIRNGLFEIKDIEIADSVLVLSTIGGEHHFLFVDLNSGELLRRWGRSGRGPGEYVRLGSGFSVVGPDLVFLDADSKEINRVSIPDILRDSTRAVVAKEPYPYVADFRPRHLIPVGDKKVCVGGFEKGSFGLLDSANNIEGHPFDYPFGYDQIQGIYRGSVFQSMIKGAGSRFVISVLSSDVFEIYENSADGIRRVFANAFRHIPQIREKPKAGVTHTVDYDKSIAGVMNMAVSDDLICFTYSAQSYAVAAGSGMVSDEILCFDWDGNKVGKYVLPVAVGVFCVDRESVYGVREYPDRTVIYRFGMM